MLEFSEIRTAHDSATSQYFLHILYKITHLSFKNVAKEHVIHEKNRFYHQEEKNDNKEMAKYTSQHFALINN